MGRPLFRVEIESVFDAAHSEVVKKDFRSYFFGRRQALNFYLKAINRAIKNSARINAYLYKDEQIVGKTEIDVRR